MCYSESREESLESKEDDSTSVASPVLGMRAMGAPMILQESSTGVNGDAFLVQGWDRTHPLTVDSPASQGLLFPIEATKSKGSQRERHTRPDSDRVRNTSQSCSHAVLPAVHRNHALMLCCLEYHCITASLGHHWGITTSLHHCITASLHYCITVSLHYYITVSLHHCITASLHHYIIASLHQLYQQKIDNTALCSDTC